MTLGDCIINAFQHTHREVYSGESDSEISLGGIDLEDEHLFYDFRATEDTFEIPIGISIGGLRSLKYAGIPVHRMQGRTSVLPKTPFAQVNNLLDIRGYNYDEIQTYYERTADGNRVPVFKSVCGLIMKPDGTPILEMTKEVTKANGRTVAYIVRINRDYIDSDAPLASYFKVSFVRACLDTRINNIPISVIVDTIMDNPLRKVTAPLQNDEEHEAEVKEILVAHAGDIENFIDAGS